MRLSTRRLEGVNRGECFWKCDGVAWMNVPAAREGDERSWEICFCCWLDEHKQKLLSQNVRSGNYGRAKCRL